MSANQNLLVRAKPCAGWEGTIMDVEPDESKFDYLTFQVRRLKAGESHSGKTGPNELGIVALGGRFNMTSPDASWENIGGRANVFAGMPWAVYLPIDTNFAVTALTDCDLAFCYCRAEEAHPAALITPKDVRLRFEAEPMPHVRSITSSPRNSQRIAF